MSACTGDGDRSDVFPGAPVVLISIDTLRSDRLPIYGYQRGSTPAIDALRHDGILAARAYTHSPLTLPAHASLFTGRLPPDHGVRDNLGYSVRPELPRLAKLLSDAGYAAGGAVSAAILRRASGIADGFEVWDEPGEGRGLAATQAERAGSATLAAILPWLRRQSNGRFFLFLHLYEPHAPYRPPAPFASRFESAYDGEVAAA
ncbi:MAG TPA: sulfatase-like hydrolase/transferase, partial [Thermoanaerobaculia bacterium]|nr:sulfatase-like hydrolase/transferase [Thermoanaerobaculia bacterium]